MALAEMFSWKKFHDDKGRYGVFFAVEWLWRTVDFAFAQKVQGGPLALGTQPAVALVKLKAVSARFDLRAVDAVVAASYAGSPVAVG
jgi:hypothetical protein